MSMLHRTPPCRYKGLAKITYTAAHYGSIPFTGEGVRGIYGVLVNVTYPADRIHLGRQSIQYRLAVNPSNLSLRSFFADGEHAILNKSNDRNLLE